MGTSFSPTITPVVNAFCAPIGKIMCLLALFFRMVPDAPVVVGANREEFFARGGEPHDILEGPARILAGLTPVPGGTAAGANEHAGLPATTNQRRTADRPQ